MPSKSQSQARLFAAMAHDPEIAKQHGVSMSTAKEWNKSDAEMGNLNKSSKLPKHVKKKRLKKVLRVTFLIISIILNYRTK